MATAGGDDARRLGLDRPYGAMFRGNAGLACSAWGGGPKPRRSPARAWMSAMVASGDSLSGRACSPRWAGPLTGWPCLQRSTRCFPKDCRIRRAPGMSLLQAELRLVEGNPEAARCSVRLQASTSRHRMRACAWALPRSPSRAAADTVRDARTKRDVDVIERDVESARCLAEVAPRRTSSPAGDSPGLRRRPRSGLALGEIGLDSRVCRIPSGLGVRRGHVRRSSATVSGGLRALLPSREALLRRRMASRQRLRTSSTPPARHVRSLPTRRSPRRSVRLARLTHRP